MKTAFKNAGLGLLLFGLAGMLALSAGTPQWKPLKLDLGPSMPAAFGSSYAVGSASVEISLYGGYAAGFGVQEAGDVASDLLTGRYSPFFGQGYDDFNWIGSPLPSKLVGAVTDSILQKNPGAYVGASLGFNMSDSIQFEIYFNYEFTKYQIIDDAVGELDTFETRALNVLQAFGLSPTFVDATVEKSGTTLTAGANFNLCFSTGGPIVPYISVGGGVQRVSDLPEVSWSLTNHWGGGTNVTYTMDITYADKYLFFASGGFGLKIYMGSNWGLRVEGRGVLPFISLDKNLATTFSATSSAFTQYTNYDAVILTEKGTPFTYSVRGGVFFGF
jgi:hypothetical protein